MPQQIYHFKAKHSLAFAWAKFMRTKRQKYQKMGPFFSFIVIIDFTMKRGLQGRVVTHNFKQGLSEICQVLRNLGFLVEVSSLFPFNHQKSRGFPTYRNLHPSDNSMVIFLLYIIYFGKNNNYGR